MKLHKARKAYVPAFVSVLKEDPSLERFHDEKKRKKLKSSLNTIDELEKDLEMMEIWHFRDLARNQFDHEEELRAIKEEMKKQRKKLDKESNGSKGGWFGGWFGSKKEETKEEVESKSKERMEKIKEASEKIAKMEADFKEAEDMLHYDPDEIPFWKQMKALDKMATIRFNQNAISVSLLNDDGKAPLTTMTVQDLFLDIVARVSYVDVKMRVQDVDVSDQFVKNTRFPSIVSTCATKKKEPILELFATAPPPEDKNLVAKVRCKMRPVDIIISLPLMKRLMTFFDTQPVNLNALRDMLLEKVASLRKSAESSVQDTMKDRKTLGLDVEFEWQVGRVILPCDPTDSSTIKSALVVHLGELVVRSSSKTEDRFDVNLTNLEIVLSEKALLERFSIKNRVLLSLQPRLGVDASTKIDTNISDVKLVVTKIT